jgi:chaperonin GroES
MMKREVPVSIALTPLEDKLIIKQDAAETTTASGLVIPDSAKEKPQQGEVLAVGPGRRDDKGERIPVDIAVGDRVLFSKYGGTELTYKGEKYLIVSARDVLAILN